MFGLRSVIRVACVLGFKFCRIFLELPGDFLELFQLYYLGHPVGEAKAPLEVGNGIDTGLPVMLV